MIENKDKVWNVGYMCENMSHNYYLLSKTFGQEIKIPEQHIFFSLQ